jgi:hypothetical protein
MQNSEHIMDVLYQACHNSKYRNKKNNRKNQLQGINLILRLNYKWSTAFQVQLIMNVEP